MAADFETLAEVSQSGSFEETMLGLEQAVAVLEAGFLSIGEAMKWYELGLALSKRGTGLLKQAELDIRMLETKYDIEVEDNPDDLEPVE